MLTFWRFSYKIVGEIMSTSVLDKLNFVNFMEDDMKGMTKVVNCIKCGAEIEFKTFKISKAEYVMGKGYICEDCVKKQKEEKEKQQ